MEVILPDDMFAEPNGRIPNLVYAVCKLCALVFVGSMLCVLSLVGPIIGLLQLAVAGCGVAVLLLEEWERAFGAAGASMQQALDH